MYSSYNTSYVEMSMSATSIYISSISMCPFAPHEAKNTLTLGHTALDLVQLVVHPCSDFVPVMQIDPYYERSW